MPQNLLPRCKQILHGCRQRAVVCLALASVIALTRSVGAQTLANIGTTAPTPGTNDISQFGTTGNTEFPDGLNFYSNNGEPPGQTFTTGSNATNLVSLAIRTS